MKIYSCGDKSKRQKKSPPGCAIRPPKKHAAMGRARGTGHRRGPLQLPSPGLAWLWHRHCAGSVGTFPAPLRQGRALNAAIVSPAAASLRRGRGPGSPAFWVSCRLKGSWWDIPGMSQGHRVLQPL